MSKPIFSIVLLSIVIGISPANAFQEQEDNLFVNGSTHSQGLVTLSSDGKYLSVYGYDKFGALGGNSTWAQNARKLAVVNAQGVYKSIRINNIHSSAAARAVVLQKANVNSYNAFLSGSGTSSNNGVQQATIDVSTNQQIGSNSRVIGLTSNSVKIFGNKLYAIGSAGETRLVELGTLNASTGGLTLGHVNLVPSGQFTDPLDFLLLGSNVLYVADKSVGLLKYYFDGTNWVAKGSITLPNDKYFIAITGSLVNDQKELFAITNELLNNALYKISDNSLPADQLSSSNYTITPIKSAGPSNGYRGVAFTPELDTTLPLSLKKFTGSVENSGINLECDFFTDEKGYTAEIHHSHDGVSFNELSTFPLENKNVRFKHSSPSLGYNYYMLKVFDISGNQCFTSSLAIDYSLDKASLGKFFIHDGVLNLQFNALNFPKNVMIFDVTGKLLHQVNTPAVNNLQYKLDAKGLILVKLLYKNGTSSQYKLINQ